MHPAPNKKNQHSRERRLSSSKTIYVFRCGDSGLYGLTTDPTGHILPSRIYPRLHWRFERRVTVEMRNSPKQEIVRATLDAIAKHGFYLTHAAIQAELLCFSAQNDDEEVGAPTRPSSRNL